MSLNITGILIDCLPNSKVNYDLKDFEVSLINQLSPKNLSILFLNNSTLILLDKIFFKNVSEEEELTSLEKDISEIFPKSNAWIFVLNDTIDFFGFSRIENGIKIRSKFVGQGRPFLDYGNLHVVEQKIYDEYSEILYSDEYIKSIFNEKFEKLDDIEVKKQFLVFRDKLLNKKNIQNDFAYLSGNMESFYIENIFEKILKIKLLDLLEIKFVTFKKSKLNFDKESLINYILTAKSQII
jgi:hypothetical protein